MLFTGNANPALASDVAAHLGIPLGKAIVGRFSDGEVNVEILENVRGKDAFARIGGAQKRPVAVAAQPLPQVGRRGLQVDDPADIWLYFWVSILFHWFIYLFF